ncbi:AaceriADL108Cp [[Ashbya] aceris (nom. inval.)]|nr:AaceriADL108Cp [[Ashbya] aceris (nom. inval.)]
MAHRKLQQEIERVFKKINEGLEIFNTYYERHENCTNNPSQKDKLEGDLKREVKKLQRLREQIKTWQSAPEVKDKDALLEYRRSVEVAMEKYKAVEKASKEKAYSNTSLKRSEVLDPEERERREVSDYLSEKIDELERQYEQLQVDMDRLIGGRKRRGTAQEERKLELRQLQTRYRWHQQQMELALRLLANEELDPQAVRDIQDDITYFIESNQEPDFVEDETIYDSLNLDANEAIAHEVAASFAAQTNEESDDEQARDTSCLSKKEQRRLEREAKRAAKLAAKGSVDSISSTPVTSAPSSALDHDPTDDVQDMSSSSVVPKEDDPPTPASSPSPSPTSTPSSSIPSTANTIATHTQSSKPQTPLAKPRQLPHVSPEHQGHTHIHQTLNGVTTSTLKPATVPAKPAGELKWAVAAAQALEKEKKEKSASIMAMKTQGGSSTPASISTGPSSHLPGANNNSGSSDTVYSTNTEDRGHLLGDNKDIPNIGAAAAHLDALKKQEMPGLELVADNYESDSTDDELPEEPMPIQLDVEEYERRGSVSNQLFTELCQNFELLKLPCGIQDMIMGSLITAHDLHPPDGKLGGFRNFPDICRVTRLFELPRGVNPPQPLDATRCTEQWDSVRIGLVDDNTAQDGEDEDLRISTYSKFRVLETFTLFYVYYYAYTPLEHDIAATILAEREWRVSKDGATWFLREGQPKFTNELCEVADFKIFKLDDWTAINKINFTLDYSILKDSPKPTAAGSGTAGSTPSRHGSLSHGRTLLQQLRRGSSAMKVEPSH